ncbi:MAG: cytochrome c biogenesis protein CcdA [Gemmatimonadales bacterium]
MAVAFLAGLLSFLSPCVLPVVPSYLSYVTGISGAAELQQRRHLALLHAALFVIGFTLIFVALGATATALGRLLNTYQQWLERIGGALILLFGLYCVGALRIGFLSREVRFDLGDKPLGFLGSVLAGMAFGAGWTPCIGPILGSILLYTSSRADFGQGLVLLLAYSLGLAIPFLVAAWALEWFLGWMQRFRKYVGWVERIAGVLLIAFGLLLMTGTFTLLSGWLQSVTPEFLRNRL